MPDRPCTWQLKDGALCGAPAAAEHLGQPLCAAHERQFLGSRSHLRDGIPPPIEPTGSVLDPVVEPEPVGVVGHTTIGGRGLVARLREEKPRD